MEIDFQKQLITLCFTVYKTKILRNNLVEEEPSQCRLYDSIFHRSIR